MLRLGMLYKAIIDYLFGIVHGALSGIGTHRLRRRSLSDVASPPSLSNVAVVDLLKAWLTANIGHEASRSVNMVMRFIQREPDYEPKISLPPVAELARLRDPSAYIVLRFVTEYHMDHEGSLYSGTVKELFLTRQIFAARAGCCMYCFKPTARKSYECAACVSLADVVANTDLSNA